MAVCQHRQDEPGRLVVLKSLGSTMAQAAQRIRERSDLVARQAELTDRGARAARRAERRRQLKTLLVLAMVFVAMVAVFSTLFHWLMEREGRAFSWPTSVYWTLTTMTTLGFGDITFESDAGRVFSIVVLLSGSTFLLVLLPFAFIQFVFMPWMADRERRRAPRTSPASLTGHLILTEYGPVEAALADRARQAGVPYVVIVADVEAAGRLHDEDVDVMVGELDDPQTYRHARVEASAMVVASRNDPTNTNIAFTVREIAPDVDITATANSPDSVDILEIAGATHVVQLGEVLGAQMAARTLDLGGCSHVIGQFAGLQIAEAGTIGTGLVGRTLADVRLRARLGVGIVGVWERGDFRIATADTELKQSTILLLAGTPEQLAAYDAEYRVAAPDDQHAVIVGGGRVGRAIGHAFERAGVSYAIVEKLAERQRPGVRYVIGDAADRGVLAEAGLDRADAILVTTHDDDVNVYLTRYCRGLRPEVRIVSRARLDRNVVTLYRAGADAVLSYAGTGSAAIWNHFRGDETLLVAQGLNVFRVPIPDELVGRTLAETHVHRRTGCNVVAVERDGEIVANPAPDSPLPDEGDLVLVGTDDAEARFNSTFRPIRRRRRLRPRT
jgi:voltage-gated potassium channel